MYRSESLVANVLICKKSIGILLILLCSLDPSIISAQDVASPQSSIQRDPQALEILAQVIAASGGSQLLNSIRDMTETGTISYEPKSTKDDGIVTVKSRGLHQLKIEADLSSGRRATIVNGYGGALVEANGRKVPIHGQSAVDLGSFNIPCLSLIAAMRDRSVSIIYVGLVSHNSVSVHDIRLQRVYPRQQDPQGDRGRRDERDIYVNPNTFLIAAVGDRLYLAGPKQLGLAHEDLYSGYQSKNGIMIPLTITQMIGGETRFIMKLDQFATNTNLTNADFSW